MLSWGLNQVDKLIAHIKGIFATFTTVVLDYNRTNQKIAARSPLHLVGKHHNRSKIVGAKSLAPVHLLIVTKTFLHRAVVSFLGCYGVVKSLRAHRNYGALSNMSGILFK